MAMKSDSSDSLDRHANDEPESTDCGWATDPLDGGEVCLPAGEGDEPGGAEAVQEYVDLDVQNRLWLKAILPLLQIHSQEADSGETPLAGPTAGCRGTGRVQFAFDQMYIAACERVARILRSDLPYDQG
jgi:hypothetical protein